MSQKELNYVEDIYNHEKLIIEIIASTIDCIKDDDYCELLDMQMNAHDELLTKAKNLLEGACNE